MPKAPLVEYEDGQEFELQQQKTIWDFIQRAKTEDEKTNDRDTVYKAVSRVRILTVVEY